LGGKKAIILAHHGYLTAGRTIAEATYLSVYLERAARMQIRARTFGPLTPVDDALAKEAHDYLLQPSIVKRRSTVGAGKPMARLHRARSPDRSRQKAESRSAHYEQGL
jgi:Class II Aldolase and Adducin N-terminal domain